MVPKKAPPPAPKKEKKTYAVIALYHFQRAEEGDLSLLEVFFHFKLFDENGLHTQGFFAFSTVPIPVHNV